MRQALLHAVELDLVVEHGGHRVTVKGNRRVFTADFERLTSLLHFVRQAWRWRRQVPAGITVFVTWRGFRAKVAHTRAD